MMAELEIVQPEPEAPEVLNGDADENEAKEDAEPSETGKKKRRKKKKKKTAVPGKKECMIVRINSRFGHSALLRGSPLCHSVKRPVKMRSVGLYYLSESDHVLPQLSRLSRAWK